MGRAWLGLGLGQMEVCENWLVSGLGQILSYGREREGPEHWHKP